MVKAIPDGMHTVTPHLIIEGAAKALDFYKAAFGAEELSRLPGPDGRLMHASFRIGTSVLFAADAFPEWGSNGPQHFKGTPVTIHLYVEDCDAAFARAIAAGCAVKMPPADMFWGDRYGVLTDPFGHAWSIATHTRDLTPAQIEEGFAAMLAEMGDAPKCGGEAGTA